MYELIENSRSGVYGICGNDIVNFSLSCFVKIGQAKSVESRRADYERIANGGSGSKYPDGLVVWLRNNPDFKFVLLSTDVRDEVGLIRGARDGNGVIYNPIDR